MSVSKKTIAHERRNLMNLMDQGDYQIPSRKVDETLLLATWNIKNFSNRHLTRALQYIADICERFDIVALQEVKTNLRGLQRLQALLPGNYKILVSDPTGNYERFAFLYDKRTVITTGLACEIGFNVTGKSHIGYQLHRMPYCASFRAGRFDFVVANVHIYYGKTKAERAERKKEIQELARFIARRAKTQRSKVFDRDFFVVGDFNIETENDDFCDALTSEKFIMTEEMRAIKTNYGRDKTYDKIVWCDRESFVPTGKMNVVPFGEVLFKEVGESRGKDEISDHLPLWAEFKINKLTQQLDQIINAG